MRLEAILNEKSFNLKTISQGDFGHFRDDNLIILSKVAKIALKIVFKLKLFPYKIRRWVNHTPSTRVDHATEQPHPPARRSRSRHAVRLETVLAP